MPPTSSTSSTGAASPGLSTDASRVAIVTGAGRGIGRTLAQALAADGCRVAAADVDRLGADETVAAIASAGGEGLALACDMASPDQVTSMVAATHARWGRIDVLVNNAALFSALPLTELEAISVHDWDRVMAVNLRGPFLAAQAVAPFMRAAGRGKIVNVSSGSALRGNAERIHYVTSKAGLMGLTRSLARALGADGICVNTLVPGITASDTALAAYPPEHFQASIAPRALKRVGQPRDLVGALLFLCGPASDFVTGQSLVVDGGNHML